MRVLPKPITVLLCEPNRHRNIEVTGPKASGSNGKCFVDVHVEHHPTDFWANRRNRVLKAFDLLPKALLPLDKGSKKATAA